MRGKLSSPKIAQQPVPCCTDLRIRSPTRVSETGYVPPHFHRKNLIPACILETRLPCPPADIGATGQAADGASLSVSCFISVQLQSGPLRVQVTRSDSPATVPGAPESSGENPVGLRILFSSHNPDLTQLKLKLSSM